MKNKIFVAYYFKTVLKASLRACHIQIDPNTSDSSNNPKRIKNSVFKRTLSLAPSEYQASMCLEASLSFSFFLLFFVNVLSIIFLFMTYTEDLSSLHQQGKKAAAYAYVTEGTLGNGESHIRLQKNRIIKSPFGLLVTPNCRLHTKCVVKPWTGYDVINGKNRVEEDSIVYITEYGTVYHKNRSCSHLALSVQAVGFYRIEEKRNESGERYVPCEYCRKNGLVTVVYITSYGNRYHSTFKCRGLKRSIKSLSVSEVEGLKVCEKCG